MTGYIYDPFRSFFYFDDGHQSNTTGSRTVEFFRPLTPLTITFCFNGNAIFLESCVRLLHVYFFFTTRFGKGKKCNGFSIIVDTIY